jgi:hypothetical protein
METEESDMKNGKWNALKKALPDGLLLFGLLL